MEDNELVLIRWPKIDIDDPWSRVWVLVNEMHSLNMEFFDLWFGLVEAIPPWVCNEIMSCLHRIVGSIELVLIIKHCKNITVLLSHCKNIMSMMMWNIVVVQSFCSSKGIKTTFCKRILKNNINNDLNLILDYYCRGWLMKLVSRILESLF